MNKQLSSSGSVYGRHSGKSRKRNLYKRSSSRRNAYKSSNKDRTSDTRKSNSRSEEPRSYVSRILIFFAGGVMTFLIVSIIKAEDVGAMIDNTFAALQKIL